jgi:hypothetical protein
VLYRLFHTPLLIAWFSTMMGFNYPLEFNTIAYAMAGIIFAIHGDNPLDFLQT